MDVWDQALQRPDAHTEPGTDCLHCESFLRWFGLLELMICGIGNLLGYSSSGRTRYIISCFWSRRGRRNWGGRDTVRWTFFDHYKNDRRLVHIITL